MRTLNLIFPSLGVFLLLTCLGDGGSCRNKEATVSKAPVESNNRLAKGVWGGQHIRLEVTASGATLEFDCGNSTIAEPIVLDRNGNFDVRGKYTPEHGGPIRNDEESTSLSVRYVGHASDKELTLTVTIPEKKETIGTYNLTHGSEGRVMKCR